MHLLYNQMCFEIWITIHCTLNMFIKMNDEFKNEQRF